MKVCQKRVGGDIPRLQSIPPPTPSSLSLRIVCVSKKTKPYLKWLRQIV